MQNLIVVAGFYFDGVTSAKCDASIEFDGGEFRLKKVSGEVANYTVETVRISSRVGNIARRFEFPDGSHFETFDNSSVDRICEQLRHRSFAFHLEASWKIALSCALGLVGFLLFSYFVLLPAFSASIARMVPASLAARLSEPGKATLEKIYLSSSKLTGGDAQRVQNAIATVKKAFPEIVLDFRLRDGGALGANAFALPDGTIYLTDDLAGLASSEEHIVAVLFHEVGHVKKLHILTQLVEDSAFALGLFLIAGGDWTNLPLLLLGNSYSRRHEAEADEFAVYHLKKVGISPLALATILQRLEKFDSRGEAEYSFLSTHPVTTDRVRAIEGMK